ncbi:MAG: hypothetical protein HOV81_23370 [Kofleriaceae bacterium]|nr:hypothetical protein [Kofleriaceae bacterium]
MTWASTGIAVADDPKPSDQSQQPSQSDTSSQQGTEGTGGTGMQGQQGQGMQGQQGEGMRGKQVMAQELTVTATVEKIDKDKRMLTIKTEKGDTVQVKVPEQLKGLEKLKTGDRLQIDYFQSVALALKKPEAGAKPGATETTMAERTAGPLPGGLAARKISATVEVMKVDKQDNEVTIKAPNGQEHTIKVDESMSSELDKLKTGDRIKANYTEAVAVSVMPEKGTQGRQGREPGMQQRSKGTSEQQDQTPKGY